MTHTGYIQAADWHDFTHNTEGFIMDYNDYLTALTNLDYFGDDILTGIDAELSDYYYGKEV